MTNSSYYILYTLHHIRNIYADEEVYCLRNYITHYNSVYFYRYKGGTSPHPLLTSSEIYYNLSRSITRFTEGSDNIFIYSDLRSNFCQGNNELKRQYLMP